MIGNGSTPNREKPEYWQDGSHPWLTSGKINDGIIGVADQFVTDVALRDCHLPIVAADSVLVAITGEGQTRGRAALLQIPAAISQHLAFVTARSTRLDASFLWRFFQSRYELLRAESSGGGSTRAALTCEYLKSLPIALPPREEQWRITRVVAESEAGLLTLTATVQEAIDRLRELRIALISAAVTGKIDVREEAA